VLSQTVSVETKFSDFLLNEIHEQEQKILRGHVTSEQYLAEKFYLRGLERAFQILGDASKSMRAIDNENP